MPPARTDLASPAASAGWITPPKNDLINLLSEQDLDTSLKHRAHHHNHPALGTNPPAVLPNASVQTGSPTRSKRPSASRTRYRLAAARPSLALFSWHAAGVTVRAHPQPCPEIAYETQWQSARTATPRAIYPSFHQACRGLGAGQFQRHPCAVYRIGG